MKSGKKGFTLIEIIISTGILAVLAVGIFSMFIASHVNIKKAMDLDNAVLEIDSLIEGFHGTENSTVRASSFAIYYDDKWERSTNDSEIKYVIYGDFKQLSEEQEGLFNLSIRAVRLKPYPFENKEKYEIYSIDVIIEDTSYWSE
ncbi:MAG: prepilin-type N-terminal cleavage/methylation domain-containing protein [Clostridiaceae bacterium]|nr:prepilin-type N-terminal cleavage/methylation domain-containing protein [Clostridiaceae bacterium]